jgi:D-alanyl-D-alanine carboxypeptidase
MSRKLFIVSTLLFLLVSALPFKKNIGRIIKPVVLVKTNTKEITFENTAIKSAYTQPSKIVFEDDTTINENAPNIISQSGVAINLNNNKILYSKNPQDKIPVASLVKVMTAILAMEHSEMGDKVVISKNAAETGENTMGLIEGEEFLVKDLLYGLILNSGNDAAVAIAEHVAGDENLFVSFMNQKAELVGSENTKFKDASGLNISGKEYYSTAEDMAKIATYSLRVHPTLREIYQTFYKEIPYSEKHGIKILENQTNLLTTYPGVKGIKTGYTQEAGLCLISYAENEGQKVLVVVLNSTDRKGDAILLLDYAFSKLGVAVEHNLL